jgi:very-short-patch-repair endonuclease
MSTQGGAQVRLAWNCWMDARLSGDFTARCAAAVAASAPETLVVSMTAARLHGMWLPSDRDEIHLATASARLHARAMSRTRRTQFVSHRREIPRVDRVIVQGVPTTSAARTWRDLASVLRLPDLVAAGDGVLREGVDVAELDAVVRRTGAQRGVVNARVALALLDARSRSRPESHLRVALSVAGLPSFAVNEAVSRDEGGWLAEPDLSLAEAKIAIEYQGEHHAEKVRMRRDLTRSTDLRMSGWSVLAYGPAEVFDRPWTAPNEVRALLEGRAPHLLRVHPLGRVAT